jgi:hypothetical protein
MYLQAKTEHPSGLVAFRGALANIWLTATFGSVISVGAGILCTAIGGGLDPDEELS